MALVPITSVPVFSHHLEMLIDGKLVFDPLPVEGALSIAFSMTSQMAKDPLTLNITIVGCGISGLAAAYALGKAGHHITVIESSPLFGDVGAGIQISPSKPSASLQLDGLHSCSLRRLQDTD